MLLRKKLRILASQNLSIYKKQFILKKRQFSQYKFKNSSRHYKFVQEFNRNNK